MRDLIYIAIIIALVVVIILAQGEKFGSDPNEPPPIAEDTATDPTPTLPDGPTEPAEENALIRVTSPTPGAQVGDPLEVRGQARGYWFFEASAPVVVTNWDGLIIGEGYITADGDWMTEAYVPFSGTIDYDLPADTYSATGTIIFQRANPSGLPENDDAYEMRVQLQQNT